MNRLEEDGRFDNEPWESFGHGSASGATAWCSIEAALTMQIRFSASDVPAASPANPPSAVSPSMISCCLHVLPTLGVQVKVLMARFWYRELGQKS